jgi:hypothetical protein
MTSRAMQKERESLIATSGIDDRNNTSKWPNQQSIRRMAAAMMSSSALLRSPDSKEMLQGDHASKKSQRSRRSRRASAANAAPSSVLQPSNRNRSTSAASIPLNHSPTSSNVRPSFSNSSSIAQWVVDHYPDQPIPPMESSTRKNANTQVRRISTPPHQQPQQQQHSDSNKSPRRNMLVRKEMQSASSSSEQQPRSSKRNKTRKITLEPQQQEQHNNMRSFLTKQKLVPNKQQQQQQLKILNIVRGVNNDDDRDDEYSMDDLTTNDVDITAVSDTESVFTMERTVDGVDDGDGEEEEEEEDTVTIATMGTMESSFTRMEMKRSTCRMLHDEILGVVDDTCRSVEQVFTAFTLQEADVKAVFSRIDRAKLQMHRSLKITTIHEERRAAAIRAARGHRVVEL